MRSDDVAVGLDRDRVPRGVIFDMDGLIVDSEPFWRRVEVDAFDRLGADIRPFLGHGKTMGLRVDEAVGYLVECCAIDDVDADRLCGDIVAGMVAAITEEASLMPGVEGALEMCREFGLRVALASGSTPPVIDAVLDRFDLRREFAVVHSAIDDHYGKPHPSIFLRTAIELELPPTSCIVLEDSLNGCIAGKAARMAVIAIPAPKDFDDPRYAIADVKLASLTEMSTSVVAQGLLGGDMELVRPRR